MTVVEAFDSIEAAVTDLGLKDKWGGEIIGAEGFGYLEDKSGGKWGDLLNGLESGMTVEQFHTEAMSLVDDVRRLRLRGRFERKLVELKGAALGGVSNAVSQSLGR